MVLHAASLFLVALAVVMLMAPAPYHRIVYAGEDTEDVYRVGSVFVTAGAAIILFTSETKVLSVLIYDINESGDLGAISVIGLGMLIITFAVVIAVNKIPGFGTVRFRT